MGLLDAVRSIFGRESSAEIRADFREDAENLPERWPLADLDFTPESLGRLDDHLDERLDYERFADAEFGSDDGAVFTTLVVEMGAYLGEVLVRHRDADWVEDEEMGAAVRVPGDEEDVVVNVFHVAAERLQGAATFGETVARVDGEP